MSRRKKKKKIYKVEPAPKKKGQVIDMNEKNIKKAYYAISFRTGGHMTSKDRPRRKNWDSEIDDYHPATR